MDLKSVLDKAKELPNQAKEAGKESLQSAIDKVLTELQGLRPILAKCGYSINNINVGLSIPPDVTLTIKHDREAAIGLEELEATTELTNVQSLIVKSLKSALSFSGMFTKFGYIIGTISVEVALIPKISVSLINVSEVK